MAESTAIASAEKHQVFDSDVLYEVVDGRIVELPPMGTQQVMTAGTLYLRLGFHAETTRSGRAVMEMLFDFTKQIGRKRRPDVAYVSSERWPRSKPVEDEDGWPVVPDLAVEVVSRTNTWNEILDKIDEYFQVGVQRVWVVRTSKKQVHVYISPTQVKILSLHEELSDEQLLPGFRLALTDLFEVVA